MHDEVFCGFQLAGQGSWSIVERPPESTECGSQLRSNLLQLPLCRDHLRELIVSAIIAMPITSLQ